MIHLSAKKNTKILFLSPFFYPEEISSGKYNTYLVQALIKAGCSVDVIASYPLYPDWQPKLTDEKIKGSSIYRGGGGVIYPKSQVLRRIVLELWFSWHVLVNYKKIINADIVLSIFPPVLYSIVIQLFLKKRIIKIGIIHDLQGILAESKKSLFRKVVGKVIKRIEILALKKCNKIICLSEHMKEVVVSDYGINRGYLTVQYPFISIDRPETETNKLNEILDKNYKNIVYSGAFGEKQMPNELLKFYCNLLAKRDDIVCHIFSRGPLFDEVSKKFMNSNDRLKFHDLVSEENLIELYDKSTIQLVPQAGGIGDGTFPSKVPNLIAQGVPVFAICDSDSELVKVLNPLNYGCCVEWDEDKMLSTMLAFLDEVSDVPHIEFREKFRECSDITFCVDDLVKEVLCKEI